MHFSNSSSIILRAGLAFLLLSPLACEQADPFAQNEETSESGENGDGDGDDSDSGDGDGDDSGDGDGDASETDTDTTDTEDSGENAFSDTLYPLADGATWTYIAKNTGGQVLGMEVVVMESIEWQGEPAFLQSDSPSDAGKWTEAVLMRTGERVYRVHKEIQTPMGTQTIVDYDPGFMRADDGWTSVDDMGVEHEYLRTQTDGDGLNPSEEPRGHIYTVLALNEEVTVPAGTFDCVLVERVRSQGTNIGERVLFWYAWGVGKVREERPAEQKIEELASASIPEGVDLP